MSSTRDRVIAVIAEVLEISRDEISTETDLIDDLGTTSLDIVNLIWRIEDEFSLGETPEHVLESLRTVGQIVDLVEEARDEVSEVVETYDFAIASDHAGVELKAELFQWLKSKGFTVLDLGPADTQSVDYPGFAGITAERIARGDAGLGVLICGSGIGMSIAANKVDGCRAAMISEPVSAGLARKHNNANVLCLGARMIGRDMALKCLEAFVSTDFDPGDDGRHRRRVNMITDLE